MTETIEKPYSPGTDPDEVPPLLAREWLVTNGLGGYASGTVVGVPTRRYHGLLISAEPAPLGRVDMLTHLDERIILPEGDAIQLTHLERGNRTLDPGDLKAVPEFRLEAGLPVWRFRLGKYVLEKRVLMPHMQNSVHVVYRLVAGAGTARLELRPLMNFRPHEAPVNTPLHDDLQISSKGGRFEFRVGHHLPALRMNLDGEGSDFTVEEKVERDILYRIERNRGYEATGDLWSPGCMRSDLAKGTDSTLVASTEAWDTLTALDSRELSAAEMERRRRLVAMAHPKARMGTAADLVLAADQFVIVPAGRVQDAARAQAAGDEVRTVIAGYHWFTDW